MRKEKIDQWQAYMRRVETAYDCSTFTYNDIENVVLEFITG